MAVEIDDLAGEDGGQKGARLAKFWIDQIAKLKEDKAQKRFLKRGETIEKRYRDERTRYGAEEDNVRRYASLWANVQILTPAIYGKCPLPIAERRFRDKDPIARGAAQILERALRNEIEINGFNTSVSHAVNDYLLPGRGTVWLRYEPEIEDSPSINTEGYMDLHDEQGDIFETPVNTTDGGNERVRLEAEGDDEESEDFEGQDRDEGAEENEENEKLRQTGNRLVRETIQVDYINWQDFMTFPHNARIWAEVTAVAKRVYMTRDQMKERFGKKIGKEITLYKDRRQKRDGGDMDPEDKGVIYEIWNMPTKEVFWIAEGYDYLCDRKDDPLNLDTFFPCPEPIFANTTTSTLYPVADYIEYQDQAIQIDELTQRISMLTKACKVAGVYNAAAKDIQRLLNESVENELIPVDDWAAFAEEGGVAGNISFLPLKEILGVLNELMQIKDKQIQEMDRLTGINDIMRGTTDARETLGAQRIKTNTTGTRLQRRQNDIARFCRDIVRLMADIMAQHFSDQTLIELSGAMYEEGLGDVDFPTQKELQQIMPMLAPPPPVAGLLPSPQPQLPPGMMGHNGGPPMGAPPPGMPPQGGPPTMQPPPQTGMLPPPIGQAPMQPPAPQVDPEMVKQMAGMMRIQKALGLIRNERLRGFRVDIDVDSTIYGDSEQEKQDRTQFVTSVTGFLQQAAVMSGQVPEAAPLLGKLLQFAVRGFRVGRDLESTIEDFCDQAVQLAKQKQAEAKQAAQSSPQMISAQAAMMTAKAKTADVQQKGQIEAGKAKSEITKQQMEAQTEQQRAGAEMQGDREKAAAEVQRQQIENQGEAANNASEERQNQQQMSMQEMQLEIEKMKLLFQSIKVSHEAMKPMETVAKGE